MICRGAPPAVGGQRETAQTLRRRGHRAHRAFSPRRVDVRRAAIVGQEVDSARLVAPLGQGSVAVQRAGQHFGAAAVGVGDAGGEVRDRGRAAAVDRERRERAELLGVHRHVDVVDRELVLRVLGRELEGVAIAILVRDPCEAAGERDRGPRADVGPGRRDAAAVGAGIVGRGLVGDAVDDDVAGIGT